MYSATIRGVDRADTDVAVWWGIERKAYPALLRPSDFPISTFKGKCDHEPCGIRRCF